MRKNYRRYRYVNIKLRRRILSLFLALSLGVGGFVVIKHFTAKVKSDKPINLSNKGEIVSVLNETPSNSAMEELLRSANADVFYEEPVIEEPVYEEVGYEEPIVSTPEPVLPTATPAPINNFNKGDSVVTTTTVNMRLRPDQGSFKLGELPGNSTVDRIAAIGNWDLVKYNNQLAFVCSDYTREADYDYNNEYYTLVEDSDIVRTTSKLYFRLGPSQSEQSVFLLDKNEELIVIGRSYNNANPDDEWLLVRARGQIGFVSAQYTRSLKETIQSMDPSIENVEVKKIGYLNTDSPVCYSPNGSIITYADKFQSVQILQENNGWYLVNIDGVIGYVNRRNVTKVDDIVIILDLSDQRTIVYVGTDIIAKERCTTGKKSTPTEIGYFAPYGISDYHEFPDGVHKAVKLWMPFYLGQGLHDASWEDEDDFGTVGLSQGCGRQMDWLAQLIYNLCKNRLSITHVLVQK
ncbi:MAG: hypothetical protein IKQ29_02380 [Bacilli bacterium]|nr:hypothetical protein [Bacilli bacterium]